MGLLNGGGGGGVVVWWWWDVGRGCQAGQGEPESAYGTVQQLGARQSSTAINAKVGSDELYATTPGQVRFDDAPFWLPFPPFFVSFW